MSNWHTLLVQIFTVYCSSCATEEFGDFDEACERAEVLRKKYPKAAIEVSALLDVEN